MSRLSLVLLALLAAAPASTRSLPKSPVRRPAVAPARSNAATRAVVNEPLDLLYLAQEHRAQFACGELAAGPLEAIFDGNGTTTARVAAREGESWAQVTFAEPRAATEVSVLFPEGARWSLLAAESDADLRTRGRTFQTLVPFRAARANVEDRLTLPNQHPYRVYRLECRAAGGTGGVAIADWSLSAPQQVAWIDVEPYGTEVARGDVLQLRAVAHFEGGGRENVTQSSSWELSPGGCARVDSEGRLEALTSGEVRAAARYAGIASIPFPVQLLAQGRPDLDVTYIERQPRGSAATSATTTWYAHISNYGTAEAPQTPVEWRVDGRTVRSGRLPKVPRFQHTEVVLTLPEDGRRHTLELVVDPNNVSPDENRENNRLQVYSDAHSVGFWVENSVHRYFHQRQRELRVGSNSWEDWAQRQVRFWNEAAEREHSPHRWRLDQVRVVGDGMLPLAGGSAAREPDRRDRSVELQFGFPAREVDQNPLYRNTVERNETNPFYFRTDLLKQLAGPLPAVAVPN